MQKAPFARAEVGVSVTCIFCHQSASEQLCVCLHWSRQKARCHCCPQTTQKQDCPLGPFLFPETGSQPEKARQLDLSQNNMEVTHGVFPHCFLFCESITSAWLLLILCRFCQGRGRQFCKKWSLNRITKTLSCCVSSESKLLYCFPTVSLIIVHETRTHWGTHLDSEVYLLVPVMLCLPCPGHSVSFYASCSPVPVVLFRSFNF